MMCVDVLALEHSMMTLYLFFLKKTHSSYAAPEGDHDEPPGIPSGFKGEAS